MVKESLAAVRMLHESPCRPLGHPESYRENGYPNATGKLGNMGKLVLYFVVSPDG